MSQPDDERETPAHDAAAKKDEPGPDPVEETPRAGDETGEEPEEPEPPYRKPTRMERRRQKIREEIERNRRGDFVVPTWVLAVILAAVVTGWALLIILA